jgi:hypothetical protein
MSNQHKWRKRALAAGVCIAIGLLVAILWPSHRETGEQVRAMRRTEVPVADDAMEKISIAPASAHQTPTDSATALPISRAPEKDPAWKKFVPAKRNIGRDGFPDENGITDLEVLAMEDGWDIGGIHLCMDTIPYSANANLVSPPTERYAYTERWYATPGKEAEVTTWHQFEWVVVREGLLPLKFYCSVYFDLELWLKKLALQGISAHTIRWEDHIIFRLLKRIERFRFVDIPESDFSITHVETLSPGSPRKDYTNRLMFLLDMNFDKHGKDSVYCLVGYVDASAATNGLLRAKSRNHRNFQICETKTEEDHWSLLRDKWSIGRAYGDAKMIEDVFREAIARFPNSPMWYWDYAFWLFRSEKRYSDAALAVRNAARVLEANAHLDDKYLGEYSTRRRIEKYSLESMMKHYQEMEQWFADVASGRRLPPTEELESDEEETEDKTRGFHNSIKQKRIGHMRR